MTPIPEEQKHHFQSSKGCEICGHTLGTETHIESNVTALYGLVFDLQLLLRQKETQIKNLQDQIEELLELHKKGIAELQKHKEAVEKIRQETIEECAKGIDFCNCGKEANADTYPHAKECPRELAKEIRSLTQQGE